MQLSVEYQASKVNDIVPMDINIKYRFIRSELIFKGRQILLPNIDYLRHGLTTLLIKA